MSYLEYKDLAPINDIKGGEEYLNALNWAFKNKKIKNIALAGPYGAGKSSVIETFLKRNKDISKKSLKISMATFVEGDIEDKEDKKIDVNADEVEQGILKQIFYKVNYSKIPQSRYRKLHAMKFGNIFLKNILLSIVLLFFLLVFLPQNIDFIWTKLNNFSSKVHTLTNYMCSPWILSIITYIISIAFVSYIWYMFSSKFKIKEIKLPTETTIQNENDSTDSVFNKNLDEIMYFFESTSYQTVFFEDLDRFTDKKIFVHLRELNNLLNNDDNIKNKPIVFVYAVKDNIFSHEDRTKFFDFIIPIIPIINSTNSGEVLLERLKESEKNGFKHEISEGFILDISPYISDMRVLQNIYNEFIIYKKTLTTSQELKLSDEQMMAIIIFKNLYPKDFSDIQNESGIIKKAFKEKEEYINLINDKLQSRINEIMNLIEMAKNDALNSVKELKTTMLIELTNYYGIVKQLSGGRINITTSNILSDNFDINELLELDNVTIHYTSFSGYNRSINQENFKICIERYVKRLKVLKEFNEKGMDKLQNEIAELQNNKRFLSGKSMKNLLKEYPNDFNLSDSVKANKLLVFLLRRGYIDEKYANYINYFKGSTITTEDMNFILSVKNQEPQSFNYQLTKTDMVIKRLQEHEFQEKAVYNFILVEKLLDSNIKSNKLDTLIEQLSDEDEISWQFIDQFIDITTHKDIFINKLALSWKGMWKYISENLSLTYERQLGYLKLILENSNDETIFNLNEDNCIVNYFVYHSDILEKLQIEDINVIINVIFNLNICFSDLIIDNVSTDLLSYIFDNCKYDINEKMINNVVKFENPELLVELESKPYTTLINLNYKNILDYVNKKLNHYVQNVIFTKQHVSDNPKDIIYILKQLLDQSDLCIEIIKHEEFCIEDISDCMSELINEKKKYVENIWNTLLLENKIARTWQNINSYWKIYKFSKILVDFIVFNVDELKTKTADSVEDAFIKNFIDLKFKEEIYIKLLPILRMKKFDISLDSLPQNILKIMVEFKYFPFTLELYENIYNLYPDIVIEYIIKNQSEFFANIEKINIDKNLLENLLLNEMLESKIKYKLVDIYIPNYMTAKIAENINKLKINLTNEIFYSAWSCIENDKKEQFMFDNIEIINADDIEHCFTELGGEKYSKLADRTKRHEVEIEKSIQNEKLAKYLKKIEYITSYEIKSNNNFNEPQGVNNKVEFIKLRIKKKQ